MLNVLFNAKKLLLDIPFGYLATIINPELKTELTILGVVILRLFFEYLLSRFKKKKE